MRALNATSLPGKSDECSNVASTALSHNVLRITAACSINPHYVHVEKTLSDESGKTSPSAGFLHILQPFTLKVAPFTYPVGCHTFHLNTCHDANDTEVKISNTSHTQVSLSVAEHGGN